MQLVWRNEGEINDVVAVGNGMSGKNRGLNFMQQHGCHTNYLRTSNVKLDDELKYVKSLIVSHQFIN